MEQIIKQNGANVPNEIQNTFLGRSSNADVIFLSLSRKMN